MRQFDKKSKESKSSPSKKKKSTKKSINEESSKQSGVGIGSGAAGVAADEGQQELSLAENAWNTLLTTAMFSYELRGYGVFAVAATVIYLYGEMISV